MDYILLVLKLLKATKARPLAATASTSKMPKDTTMEGPDGRSNR